MNGSVWDRIQKEEFEKNRERVVENEGKSSAVYSMLRTDKEDIRPALYQTRRDR